MDKIPLLLSVCVLVSCSTSYEMSWHKHGMDSHRTGVSVPNADNVESAMGTVSEGVYKAPNGRAFRSGSTPDVAEALISVQPQMRRLKEVLGHSPALMDRHKPECALGDMLADLLIKEVSGLSGRQVDVSFLNTGGIRTDMPAGDIMLDDVVSMLPFNNKLCYLTLKGSDLRAIYEFIASDSPQAIGGARIRVENHEPVSVEIGGKPLDDNAFYGVATIDFLLDGGDGLHIAKNAAELVIYDELPNAMLEKYIRALTSEGKEVSYEKDGRVIWK